MGRIAREAAVQAGQGGERLTLGVLPPRGEEEVLDLGDLLRLRERRHQAELSEGSERVGWSEWPTRSAPAGTRKNSPWPRSVLRQRKESHRAVIFTPPLTHFNAENEGDGRCREEEAPIACSAVALGIANANHRTRQFDGAVFGKPALP